MRGLVQAVAVICLGCAGPAGAAVIDVGFTGTFDLFRSGCSPYGVPAPGNCTTMPIASPFIGSFSYSTDPGFAISGTILNSDAFSMTGRATTLTGSGGNVSFTSGIDGDTIRFGNLLGSTYNFNLAGITLTYPPGTFLTQPIGTSLLPAIPAIRAVTSFSSGGSPGGSGPGLDGFVSSFIAIDRAAGAVPEPATWGMMIFGTGLTGASLRRRKSNTTKAVHFDGPLFPWTRV